MSIAGHPDSSAPAPTAVEPTDPRSGGPAAPHGGRLVDRRVPEPERAAHAERAARLPSLGMNVREALDLEMIASGAFSPLEGFVGEDDHRAIVDEGRLASGLPWTLPITLSVKPGEPLPSPGDEIALRAPASLGGELVATLAVADVFRPDRQRDARKVYGTDDPAHPGVAYELRETGEVLIGGRVSVFGRLPAPFPAFHAEPRQTRALFAERRWRTIAAFQTRNPIHRAHEYLTKVALEICDGLLLHPLVGHTKEDDVPAEVRMRCYEALVGGYYPPGRVALAALPAAMRYAGPREAVLHAIVRKNHGCTHFIVGRDHAGVGSYYGTYDAQRIFDRYDPAEIGVTLLRFENAFYCRSCAGMASSKSCPHDEAARVSLSGTRVRELLRAGTAPPPELTRPEVARILIDAMASSSAA